MHLILSIERLSARALQLQFEDGSSLRKDFSALIAQGGIFARLADETYWEGVSIADGGRALAWPEQGADPMTGLDLCADALWFEAHPREYQAFLASFQQPAA